MWKAISVQESASRSWTQGQCPNVALYTQWESLATLGPSLAMGKCQHLHHDARMLTPTDDSVQSPVASTQACDVCRSRPTAFGSSRSVASCACEWSGNKLLSGGRGVRCTPHHQSDSGTLDLVSVQLRRKQSRPIRLAQLPTCCCRQLKPTKFRQVRKVYRGTNTASHALTEAKDTALLNKHI